MDDARVAVREARNLLERLDARVPGFAGYLERELRREVDQRLRADLAGHPPGGERRRPAAQQAAATEVR